MSPRAISSPNHEAASAILALIHSKPQSPRIDEIEAILAQAVPSSAFADHHHDRLAKVEEWINKTQDGDAKSNETKAEADIDEADRINAAFGRYCEAIWSVPPQTLTGLQERAALARYWHQIVGEEWEEPDDCDDWGNRTIAELIKAVQEFGSPPSKRSSSASEIDFKPVLGSDGLPIVFEWTNEAFGDHYLPWVRLAFVLLGKDKDGVLDVVRGLVTDADDPEASHLFAAFAMWEEIENKFEAIAAFAGSAWARMTAAMETLEEMDPSITEKLGPFVDRYLAQRQQAEAAQ